MFFKNIIKCLTILFYISNLAQLSHQVSEIEENNNHIDLKKPNTNTKDNNSHQKHQDAYKTPFIVLMSEDSISVAQMPLIENGNLTVVYRLIAGPADRNQEQEEEDTEDDNEEYHPRTHGDSQDQAEDEEVSPRRRPESGADVREYEQMPPGAISATASLGKSEWQQIATGNRNREEAWPQPAQTAATSRKEDDAQEASLPRRRRSNSFLSLTDDAEGNNRASSNSSETGNASESTDEEAKKKKEEKQQQQQSAHYSDQNEQTVQKSTNSKTGVQESSSNVTSAQFATDNEQANSNATEGKGGVTTEEDDKNSQTQSGPDGSSSSSSSSSWSPSQDASSFSGPIGFDGLKFSDFDVHISLGYAFVADSTGRIHRFRLLRESSSSSSAAASGQSTKDDLMENDYTNTIESGLKFEFSPQQSRISGAKRQQSSSTTRLGSASIASSDNAENEASSFLLNRASNGRRNNDDVTHEQSGDERQHPAISGGQQLASSNSDKVMSDAPISGSSQTKFNQQLLSSTNGRPTNRRHNELLPFVSARRETKSIPQQLEHIAGAEPKIIWSRSKFRSPLAAVRAAKSTSKGASSSSSASSHAAGHQVADEETSRTSHRLLFEAAKPQHDTAGHKSDGESGQEATGAQADLSRFASSAKLAAKAKKQTLATQIAVDWLNNLIFVLDKYRLLVVDFDGNNELVLIDDFNQNNRPVDLKVDPVNDFLFWLQVGKFHNTIYKLNLNVLSVPSATQRLVGNTLKLRQSGRIQQVVHGNKNSTRDVDGGFDTSDLVALVSHHYAHPIITNLPRHAKLFTIDHKHSRIYVPLTPSPNVVDTNETKQAEDAEIFAQPADNLTHLNSNEFNLFEATDKNCTIGPTKQLDPGANGQILAYNLDGTDVGPLRSVGDDSHITHLEDMQDITVDTGKNLLYWLGNEGRDIFEEYRINSDASKSIYLAQHHMGDKNYIKLIHFDNEASNQPTGKKSRFNMRNLIHMLSNSIQPNRQTRKSEDGGFASSLNSRHRIDSDTDSTRFSRNAPFIILGVTCLIVVTVYLIYALIFQRVGGAQSSAGDSHCGDGGAHGNGSIGGGSSLSGSQAGPYSEAGTMFNTSTVSRWIVRAQGPRGSSLNRDLNGGHVESCDLESTNYDTSNAIDEHYRGSNIINHQTAEDFFGLETTNRLANLSQWPTNMHDMSNKLYIPVEVLQDEALSSIHRVSIDELEIERRPPLGEGHFGTVLQGTIKSSVVERSTSHKPPACYVPMSPDSLAPPSQHRTRLPMSSTGSSGHGSSSSTSYEFRTANNCTDATTTTTNGDYLTPKSHCNSAMSDYNGDNQASSEAESFSSYGNMSAALLHKDSKTNEIKLRVAIKKLKDNPSPDEKRDFLQEAKLLANFDHPNIVHLIGICLDRGSTLIVMELMLGGDLIRYMKENVPSATTTTTPNCHVDKLTHDDLLKICLDIVNGCCYLEELDYIHRDLAARNCLVSSRKREERVVKLADFGLARDIYKDSYYKKLNDSAMPLKWMAPECLIEQKFTKKSDVWSFGVVMWEVMSYCQEKPYEGVEPCFVRDHLASGRRLRKPDSCDDDMYRLMNQCWQMDPANRPTFHECRAILIEIRNGR